MSNKVIAKNKRHTRRKFSIRNSVSGSPQRPRLSVFRSNKHIEAQIIDDIEGKTLAAASSKQAAILGEAKHGGDLESAKKVGVAIAEKAKSAGITKIVFDRNGRRYHGRVKALADAAREGGLEF
ncbi:MAG: 50S ribosomal protein L18 [Planctomycetota bacterium]